MTRRLRVGVIFGGRSGEHDVSLRSAQAIMRALDPDRFELVPIGITREGRWITGGDPLRELAAGSRLPLAPPQPGEPAESRAASGAPARVEGMSLDVRGAGWTQGIDVLFPVLHGPFGEDGTVQGLFELADIPYVGAGVLASSVSMDKAVAKRLFAQAGLPQAPWICVLRRDWRREPERVAERVAAEIGFPCFTKPANLGSSVGVVKVHDAGELAAGLDEAARHDRKIVVEAAINARELEVSVLGNDDVLTSVVGEIVPCNEFYDYSAKYIDDSSELLIPAPIEPRQAEAVREIAAEAFRVVDAAGMARVDFFVDRETNALYLNEINTIPGFTAISMYPKLWEASGLPFRDLVTRLIELAIERHRERRAWDG